MVGISKGDVYYKLISHSVTSKKNLFVLIIKYEIDDKLNFLSRGELQ